MAKLESLKQHVTENLDFDIDFVVKEMESDYTKDINKLVIDDDFAAKRFAEVAGNTLKYCSEENQFYCYNYQNGPKQ